MCQGAATARAERLNPEKVAYWYGSGRWSFRHVGWIMVIHPHSGSEGGYVNFMSDDDGHRAPLNYGANYDRLAAVKAVYDPDNIFHVNQNIQPAKKG